MGNYTSYYYNGCQCQALNNPTLYCECGYEAYQANPDSIRSRCNMLKQIREGGLRLKSVKKTMIKKKKHPTKYRIRVI